MATGEIRSSWDPGSRAVTVSAGLLGAVIWLCVFARSYHLDRWEFLGIAGALALFWLPVLVIRTRWFRIAGICFVILMIGVIGLLGLPVAVASLFRTPPPDAPVAPALARVFALACATVLAFGFIVLPSSGLKVIVCLRTDADTEQVVSIWSDGTDAGWDLLNGVSGVGPSNGDHLIQSVSFVPFSDDDVREVIRRAEASSTVSSVGLSPKEC